MSVVNLDKHVSINTLEAYLEMNELNVISERMKSLRQIRHMAISWNTLIYS